MPNTFAYIALFSWPLIMLVLFRTLPIPKALTWSLLAGYLLLPTRAEWNWQAIPALDKTSIPTITAALLCLLLARAHQKNHLPIIRGTHGARHGWASTQQAAYTTSEAAAESRTSIFTLLIIVALLSPFLTALTNSDTVVAGPRVMAGLTWYDAFSMSASAAIMLLPFMLGMRFMARPEEHRYLLWALVVAGVAYSFLVLFEVRMSPRLNIWIYGFFPHQWTQHLRGGGFRPVVFLNHGLAVGLFLAMAVVASCVLWRETVKARITKHPWVFATAWIAIALLLSRNLGATALAVLFAPVALFIATRTQLLVAAVVAITVVTFPMLRGAGLVPTEQVLRAASAIDPVRAGSLEFRFTAEDALLERASEKPLAGWGAYGRNRVYHPRTGRNLTVTDGRWVLTIGQHGWVGYLARFGLMALPLFLIWRALRKTARPIDPYTAGLCLVVAVSLVDTIPNDFQSPVFWLAAGALAGRYRSIKSSAQERMPDKRSLALRRLRASTSRHGRARI